MILVPVKRAAYPGTGENHNLHSVFEFLRCETQGFGSRPEVYGPGGHNGLDFAYEEGTELFAPFDGFAYYKEEPSGYGKYLTIIGSVYKVVYAHLKERVIMDGQVKAGQLVARGNSSGFSDGNHLHITVKRVDANGNVLDRDNGTDGAIDPTKLFQWDAMSEQVVKKQYKLSFHRLPSAEELAFWVGKEQDEFLTTALADRAKFLQEPI